MLLSRPVYAHEEITARDGMVVAQHPLGARIGVEVLKKGGNAVDAAITTAFAMGVLQPLMSGVGGGGNMVLYFDNAEPAAIYYGMRAPGLARPDMYELAPAASELAAADGHFSRSFAWPEVKGQANTKGHSSIGVPGTVAGLIMALERWGTMDLGQALAPAIRLAEEGFAVGHHFTLALIADRATFQAYPGTTPIYYPDGQPIPVGARFIQKDHARTLKLVAKRGNAGFYKGEVAERISEDCAKHGGTLRAEDLAAYRAQVMEPIRTRYRTHEIVAMPHLTAGMTLVEILNILEHFDLGRIGWGKPDSLHIIAEAIRLAAADRFTYMGDHTDAPLARLAERDYGEAQARRISMRRAGPPTAGDPWTGAFRPRRHDFPKPAGGAADSGTTHLTVIDKHRNAVALTQTNVGYSGVVNPGVGVMMNNAMSWFCPVPGTINSIGPGKTGLNNMTPVIVTRGGRLKLALGASGGRRVWTAVAQAIVNHLDFDMSLQEAVQAPRLHVETDDLLMDGRFGSRVKAALEKRGHKVYVATPHFDGSPFAEPNGIAVAGTYLRSAVYPVAKPTYGAGYSGGDAAPAEADTLASRPDLYP